ncbi:hypothetical protein [Bradyrhizobium sp. CCBAU 11434]|nr:hypothetical protein [Bradyrhizobium sp. CCBAU 11434]
MAKVTSEWTGDQLVGIAADGPEERPAARWRSPICRSRPWPRN